MSKKKVGKQQKKSNKVKKQQRAIKSVSAGRLTVMLHLAIILVLGTVIYSNSFDCTFHFDDIISIVNNDAIKDVSDINTIWKSNSSRFIAYLSLAINHHFGALNVWGYHFFNLMIHLTTSLLVYWLMFITLKTPNVKSLIPVKDHHWIALVVALIFVSHPLATQSVTYIIQRMASMVTLFYLFAIILYLKGRLNQGSTSLSIGYFITALIAAIFALFTKENAFTIPLVILLVEISLFKRDKIVINFSKPRIILGCIVFLSFLLLLFSRVSSSFFQTIPPSFGHTYTVTPWNYLLTQFSVIAKYIQLLCFPINLNFDYDYAISNSLIEPRTFLSLGFLLALVGLSIYLFKKQKLISFGIMWFFITISIESSFIPLADLIFEHRTYLPSVGFFMILTVGIYQLVWQKNKKIALGLIFLIIGTNSFATYQRNKIWKNEGTLWNDVIAKSPDKARPYLCRGNYYKNLKRNKEALSDFTKSISLNPAYIEPYNNKGTTLYNEGLLTEALSYLNYAIENSPDYTEAYINKGIVLATQKKYSKALENFNRAIAIEPNNADIYINRGLTYLNMGDKNKSCLDISNAIKLKHPEAQAIYNNECR
ncbi:tetratricopeptide repeat protein [Saprospiraceae bacterium]|nr:tetratricopeptide repeat protein [Saprospiraceae bacterium]